MKTALTIAGSDSGGGAGIQADLKTFAANGVFGMSVLTAVTAQNTRGVSGVEILSPEIINAQLNAVFSDLPVDAVKIGMVANCEAIGVIADRLLEYNSHPIVLDPVMISKSGHPLLEKRAQATLIDRLLPLATLVTPNLSEASELTGDAIHSVEDMERVAQTILSMGPQAVLVKGGHLEGEPIDVLASVEGFHHLKGRRIATRHTHGTGCTLSSAIAAHLATGHSLIEAARLAKAYVQSAIEQAPGLGAGSGPLQHFYHGSNKLKGATHDEV